MSPLDPQAGAGNPVTETGRMAPKEYDGVLLASFGGPEGQDDVIPFLRNVTRGRGIPDERLEEVSHHYRANGGISPINQQNRELKAALEAELAAAREQVAALQQADLDLRTEQPDAVHQLRVSARRLRSTLAALRAVLEPAATVEVREELRWLGSQLSEARDDEVALAHLRELVDAQPAELVLGPVVARLQQMQVQEERAGLDRALETLSGARYLALLDAAHALVTDPPFTDRAGDRLEPVLQEALRGSVKRLGRHMATARAADGDARHESLHAVRKAAKRVRYATEIAGSELSGAKDVVRVAKYIQKVLGEVQDTVVTRELCRRLGAASSVPGENGFTFGRLHALEQARAERGEEAFWAFEPEARKVLKRSTR
jgi:CHAD domain-containing protein